MSDYAIRAGDRVRKHGYGTGTVVSVERVSRGHDTYWLAMDDPRVARFGKMKAFAEQLTRLASSERETPENHSLNS